MHDQASNHKAFRDFPDLASSHYLVAHAALRRRDAAPYTRVVGTHSRRRNYLFVIFSFALLFVPDLQLAAAAGRAKGRFELYCVGAGIFLTHIDGAPAPRKLGLFLYTHVLGGTRYFGQGEWQGVFVYSDGCVPEKCDSVGRGRVWIDGPAPGPEEPPPTRISGKYEIGSSGKHLEGYFVAKAHIHKPVLICE